MAARHDKYLAAEQALWNSFGLTPTEQWIRFRGGENVRLQVVGDGPPVVFVHGGSSSGANWAPMVAEMQDFRCVLIDRPGCGVSDPIANGITDFAEFERFADGLIEDVLDGLGLASADVVATSMGGYFAIRSAAAHPQRVRRLVEVTFPLGAPTDHAPLSMRLATIPGLSQLSTRMPANRFVVKMILKQLGLGRALESGRMGEELIDWFLALLRHTNTMANELRDNPKVLTPIAGLNQQLLFSDELLAKIEQPVLFVWGGEDPMGGEATGRDFADRFPHARFELLPLAGHAPWIDEPERCATLTRDFLGEPPA